MVRASVRVHFSNRLTTLSQYFYVNSITSNRKKLHIFCPYFKAVVTVPNGHHGLMLCAK